MPPLWREPSAPPVPWHRAILQSGTWRGVPSNWWRSWRVASISRNMPRIPGWLDDRPPPSVLMGSLPPIFRAFRR